MSRGVERKKRRVFFATMDSPTRKKLWMRCTIHELMKGWWYQIVKSHIYFTYIIHYPGEKAKLDPLPQKIRDENHS